jgi:hypothetical protein
MERELISHLMPRIDSSPLCLGTGTIMNPGLDIASSLVSALQKALLEELVSIFAARVKAMVFAPFII